MYEKWTVVFEILNLQGGCKYKIKCTCKCCIYTLPLEYYRTSNKLPTLARSIFLDSHCYFIGYHYYAKNVLKVWKNMQAENLKLSLI